MNAERLQKILETTYVEQAQTDELLDLTKELIEAYLAGNAQDDALKGVCDSIQQFQEGRVFRP